MNDLSNRRPITQRTHAWAVNAAAWLAKNRVSPDTISLLSVAFAAFGFGALAFSGLIFGPFRSVLLLVAAMTIQLRLLANMLDGMVAVEHGKGGPLGPMWNELPDRLADALFLVGAGYAATDASADLAPALGWLCALLAVMTAYVRELGRGLGLEADFSGPLAKPQRMALLTLGVVVSAFEGLWNAHGQTLLITLGLMAALTAVTVINRTIRLSRALRWRKGSEPTNKP